jgi:hypothetical protein
MSRARHPSRLAEVSVAARICLLACVSTVALASCGSSAEPTIPAENANAMLSSLEGISASVAAGSCDIALKQADDFKRNVDLLPAAVDDEVKQGLFDVADQLPKLIEEQASCRPSTTGASGVLEPAEETTGAPTTSATTTTTTDTDTTTTTTDTTEPEPGGGGGEATPPPEPQPAPEDGGGATGGPTSGGIGGEKGVAR